MAYIEGVGYPQGHTQRAYGLRRNGTTLEGIQGNDAEGVEIWGRVSAHVLFSCVFVLSS